MESLKSIVCLNCGGEVTLSEDGREATCKYCRRTYRIGSTLKNSALISFSFATEYWKDFHFQKAKEKFLEVAKENPEFSEAWWGAFVSEYGIEFGRNRLGEKVPTCHRAHTVEVNKDKSYLKAVETADEANKEEYISIGNEIERIRAEIIKRSEDGESYDIFICFKKSEIGDPGKSTEDYYLGRELYHELKEAGYNVFFSAETLKRINEQEFEPYIFKALSTARVMLVLCSDNEKIESAWVKNEWGRFLDMRGGKGLIPICGNSGTKYSPYNLPEELRKLNAIEFGGNLFEDLKVKIEAYFPERVKARKEAEKKAREAEYDSRYAQKIKEIEEQNAKEREAERQAQEERWKKQQEQLELLMKKMSEQSEKAEAPAASKADPAAQLSENENEENTSSPASKRTKASAEKAPKAEKKHPIAESKPEKAAEKSREQREYEQRILKQISEETEQNEKAEIKTYNVRVERFSEKIECVKKIQKYGKLGLVDAKETLENKREFTVEATKDGMFNIYLDFLSSGVISYYNASKIKNTDKKMTALELSKALSNGFEIKNGELVKFHPEKYKFDGKVRQIFVPEGIKRIGEHAFGNVNAFALHLPYSVTEIGKNAFRYAKISEIECQGVIRVEDEAFKDCDTQAMIFKPALAFVGDFSFECCNAEVSFPETLTYVGYNPFKSTQNAKITVHPENPIYRAVDGRLKCTDSVDKISPRVEKWLYDEKEPSEPTPVPTSAPVSKPEAVTETNYTLGPNGRLMKAGDGIVNAEIPAGVTSIDEGVFENSSTLHSVTLSQSCTIINPGAFRGCKRLRTVSFPNMFFIGNEAFCGCEMLKDVKLSMSGSNPRIGNGAFKGCESLESFECTGKLSCVSEEMLKGCRRLSEVRLPEGVTEIKARAFEGCRDLLTLHLPSTLKRIENDAFADCRSLTSVYFAGTKEQWCGIENVGAMLAERDSEYLMASFEEYDDYEKASKPVLYIDNKPLGGSLVFPESVTEINPGAFSRLSAIRGVTFKSGSITVGKDAFSGCESLSRLNFSECGNINIEDGAFEFCYDLKSIDFPPDDRFARVTVGNSAFGNCCELSELKFGKNTSVKLADFAFDECKELNSVTASGRIELCDDTFNDCHIGTFYYRDTMEHWCENEFTDESNPSAKSRRVEIDGRCVNDVIIIPEGAERLKPYTFVSCNFSSIEIWEPNIKIDKNAFYECTFPSVIRVAYNGLFPPKWVKEVFGKVKVVKLKL